ncbi:MAG TPA: HEAT repeat domain-containing protein [Cyclobacteriaceae bacterium]|nr:HEAT repeat domain-containing protein [Cyclobacteriaceae bacterium]
MEQNKIEELVAKYNEGLTDPSEVQALEQLIEEGKVDLTQLRSLDRLDEQLIAIESPATSLAMDDKFYAMLSKEKKKAAASSFNFTMPSWSWLAPRLAFSVALVVIGFGAGYMLNTKSADPNVELLTQQVADLKESIALSLFEKESATDRLKAVSLTTEMDQVSKKVTEALFQTLNNDPNVNVRLAALEAITPYSKDGSVREQLIRSIGKQESPLVQVALAELMGGLQEKKSVTEFDKILKDERTPLDVKNRIKESIKVLI